MKTRFLLAALFLVTSSAQAELVIYTDRSTDRLSAAAQKFQESTGQAVRVVESNYGELASRLKAEGSSTSADLLLVKDLVFLENASQNGWLQPMQASSAVQNVRPQMKDPSLLWTGLTYRVRTLVYADGSSAASKINSYSDLGQEEWAGKLCLRSSESSYNQALVAFLVKKLGNAKALSLVKSWVDNLAQAPLKNDTAVIEAIANGQCEIGLVNHYYLAALLAKNPSLPVKLKFISQGQGVHSNGAGIGIIKHSKQKALAQKFIDLMLSAEILLPFSQAHFDYPTVKGLEPTSLIRNWGSFTLDPTPWSEIGKSVPSTARIFQEAGYK